MTLLDVLPIQVRATPLEIAIYTQTGIVLFSVMEIMALWLFKYFAASIALERGLKGPTRVIGSFR